MVKIALILLACIMTMIRIAVTKQKYAQAGITDPRKELDMCEIHNSSPIAELIATESLNFCESGKYN